MSSINFSASKWLCWLKMKRTIRSCCLVQRCGFDRLARYSRNFASGLCDTSTDGNCTTRPPPAIRSLSIIIVNWYYRAESRFANSVIKCDHENTKKRKAKNGKGLVAEADFALPAFFFALPLFRVFVIEFSLLL